MLGEGFPLRVAGFLMGLGLSSLVLLPGLFRLICSMPNFSSTRLSALQR